MNKIKLAILGYGRSGSSLHANAIEKLPEFDVTAICDIDETARNKARERFGCRIYVDYKEMLEKEELDLVVIVTRSDQHTEMTCDCLKAGKNVLITKPWALNANDGEKMIAAANESGKMLLPWLPARWGDDLIRLRELIQSGIIGKVFQVRRSEFTFGMRNDWQTEKKHGGGYLLNWGPHLVDQPIQLLGENIKTVYGQMRQVINPGDVEDVFFGVLTTESGAIIVTEFNIGAEKLPNWMIQGDKGTIFVNEKGIEIHKAIFGKVGENDYRSPVKMEVISDEVDGDNRITIKNRYGDALVIYQHIAKAICGEIPYAVTTESALKLTKVLDGIRKSSETSSVVQI